MRTLRVSTDVSAPATVVFAAFWDMERLQAIWNPITQVRVTYDDSNNQECLILVERDGQEEHIRIIRFRSGGDILFFNPNPPPMMTFHRGAWRFQPKQESSCVIVAEREYELVRQAAETDEKYTLRANQFHCAFQLRLENLLASYKRNYLRFGEESLTR